MQLRSMLCSFVEVPPSYTWRCQPADVAWMKPFKARIRSNWVDKFRRQLAVRRGVAEKVKIKAPTRQTMAKEIYSAWAALPKSMITNGFKKCGLPYVDCGAEADIGAVQDCVVDREFVGLLLDARVACELSALDEDEEESGEYHDDDDDEFPGGNFTMWV